MKTMLVIDPTEGNRDLLAALFHYTDVRVLTARTADEGIELALEERPDLIVTEFLIPGKAGHCVVEELSRHDELDGIPVIVWAVEGIGDVEARTEVAGGRFLPKGSPPLVLFQEISGLLDLKLPPRSAPPQPTGNPVLRPSVA